MIFETFTLDGKTALMIAGIVVADGGCTRW